MNFTISPILKRALHTYLWLCARLVLRTRRPLIVGITGTVGKTTTKEVVAAVLSRPEARSVVGTVLKTPGNLNDNVGLPFTVLQYDGWTQTRFARRLCRLCVLPFRALKLAMLGPYPDTLVLEYDASIGGDVPRLVALAPPTVAVVTAIGPAHLERFGTMERIAHEKGALVRAVPPSGLVVLGANNPYADQMASHTSASVIMVDGAGRALSENVARAIGAFFRLPDQAIEAAIRETLVVHRRLKVHNLGQLTVIDDSISANPLSMKLGLATLGEISQTRRKIAVLGYMPELGSGSQTYHEEIAEFARGRADLIVGVGTLAKHYAPQVWFETVEACISGLPTVLRPGDIVFVKGAMLLHMDRVVAALRRISQEWGATGG